MQVRVRVGGGPQISLNLPVLIDRVFFGVT